MTQHPKLGVKPDALSVVRCRDYHGHYYIEGAPFRILFWTYATDIDANEAQRRLDFANELVAAWNNREAAEAASKAREAALVELVSEAVVILDNANGVTDDVRFDYVTRAIAALTKEPQP